MTRRWRGPHVRAKLRQEIVLCQAELKRREERIWQLIHALRETLEMLDASSFGGHKIYRCLTPAEQQKLTEIRRLVS